MNFNPTPSSWRILPVCAASLMLGACAHRVTEREVVHEQPIIQQAPAQPEHEVVHEQPIIQQAPAQPEHVVVVQPPPAPQESMAPAPAPSGYSWLPGHYTWRDGWHWEHGRWVSGHVRPMPAPYQEDPLSVEPPTGAAQWVPGYWEYNGSDWAWTGGHWESRLGAKGDGSTGGSQVGSPPAAEH